MSAFRKVNFECLQKKIKGKKNEIIKLVSLMLSKSDQRWFQRLKVVP